MDNFMIRFLLCNIFISIVIGLLLATRRLLKNILTRQMQYRIWFLLLGLLAVPFLPLPSFSFLSFFSWFSSFQKTSASPMGDAISKTAVPAAGNANWMNDFGAAIHRHTPDPVVFLLFGIWILGMLGMAGFLWNSAIRFHKIKKSALPLQNPAVRERYVGCCQEMHIAKNIPTYTTAYLKSPAIAGFFKPCIYLPLRLISGLPANELRYILLHELFHFKHKDTQVNFFMNLASMIYWFHPLVWYALREMRLDREIACDTSVLQMLGEEDYRTYGDTLINFAEKLSRSPFPVSTGISGSMAQMKRRILNIATYRTPSMPEKLRGFFACLCIAILLSGFVPILSIPAADGHRYHFQEQGKQISYLDLSDAFGKNNGSFVLYDSANDSWNIYNKEYATMRISPASTFKLYSALFALESGIISPGQSLIPWDKKHYRYDLWNDDQTLESAMQNSVTWYFQALDRKNYLPAIEQYLKEIGYGNQTVGKDIATYWIDSSLKISPIEQIEMLKKFHGNEFHFSPENIEAVKNSIRLFSSGSGTLYGKTGTEEVNGKNVSGWFIGYLEQDETTYFFAANIQNDDFASGPAVAKLTFSILSDLGLWEGYGLSEQ